MLWFGTSVQGPLCARAVFPPIFDACSSDTSLLNAKHQGRTVPLGVCFLYLAYCWIRDCFKWIMRRPTGSVAARPIWPSRPDAFARCLFFAQLFVNVLVSGIKILTMGRGLTRRTRFIAAMSLAVGLGVTIVPQFVNITNDTTNYPRQGPLWPTRPSWSPGFRGARTRRRAWQT